MKINLLQICLIIGISFLSCARQPIFISPNNPSIDYVGRISFKDSLKPEMYWSGTSVSINFKGEEVYATLNDENGLNYFNVVIDEDSVYPLKLKQGEHQYLLASGLTKRKEHTISLVKRNEWITGSTQFCGFTLKGKNLPASPDNGRLIEFYGNSITAGYAIEDNTGGDSPDSTFTNNYLTYAALTARHFKADVHCIVRSGIGINVSWDRPIMPEIFDRTNPQDSLSHWDFSSKTPNVVVVNLMQNDSWLVNKPNYPEFKYRFGDKKPDKEFIRNAYANFISKLRNNYPSTPIICALGSMDATKEGSEWPQIVEQAVHQLNDANIYTLVFPYIEKKGHPRVEDDKKMANQLIRFIDDLKIW